MPKQFADICRRHPHFAHPGGGGRSCRWEVMRPTISVWLTSASLHSRGIVESLRNVWPHALIAILEEIARRFVSFAILQRLLVWWSHTFPHFNSISDVRGNRDIKLPFILFVGTRSNTVLRQAPPGCPCSSRISGPIPAHTPDAQPPDLIHSSSGRDPDEARSSIKRKWKVKGASGLLIALSRACTPPK